ncbi:SRPBCC family protein [Mycolicibacterium mucogenicum]|uniref:SRPBCC family protein n=2 Tax=Mycolicibacterium mucogenicum TaxID=56689 RepID=A0A4R5W7I1_MYCMU|nr:SRPBCC family protein [Mycolicibacterium mucogenicum]
MEHRSVSLVNMTHHYEVLVTRHARATPSTLFDVVADGSRWSEWARPLINYSAWETRGPADDGGVGAIRAVGTPRFPAREQTTIHEPGRRHGYTIISKTPVRNYQAQVTFTPEPDGTRVDWHGTFESPWCVVGLGYRAVVKYVLTTLSAKLVIEAERREALRPTP